jgi:hypothetical protein
MRYTAMTKMILRWILAAALAVPALALPWKPGQARLALYFTGANDTYDGGAAAFRSETVLTFTLRGDDYDKDGFLYGIDLRGSGYPSTPQSNIRLSIYDAYVGGRIAGGLLTFRVGQLWITEMGALGSIGGASVDFSLGKTSAGRLRLVAFAGLEPKIMDPGYESGISKFGAYAALEGDGARRHVLGYVGLRNNGLTERSVVVFQNYVPVGRTFFLYQALEYDLKAPAGAAQGTLSYFFANARLTLFPGLEVQGTFHRGLSIDRRSLSADILAGRPLDHRTAEGFLYESVGGRVTLRVLKGGQLSAGYSEDKTNMNDGRSHRWTFGLYAANVLKTGFDMNVSDWRMSSEGGSSYDSLYASLGKSFGSKVYLEAFYSSSISVFRYLGNGSYELQSYPRTNRFGMSSVLNILPMFTLLITAESTSGDRFKETRIMSGLTYRF